MSSTSTWYIRKAGVVHGPASIEDVQRLLQGKQVGLSDEASSSQSGPWQALSTFAEFAPVRPISELFATPATPAAPAAAAAAAPAAPVGAPAQPASQAPNRRSPTAERLLAETLGEFETETVQATATPAHQAAGPLQRTLSPADRKEFEAGLATEVRKKIDDKAMPASLIAGGLILILLARVNIAAAFIAGFIAAGITYKLVKDVLASRDLNAIPNLSDQILVSRYNEAKADRRAARTRSAIGWAVILIVAVILLVAWAALRSHS